jgi:hypothetical protein
MKYPGSFWMPKRMSNNHSFLGPRHLTVLLILLVATFLLAVSDPITSVKVRPGDSVSYLCFKHLGAYNEDIAAEMKKLNPEIKDLDLIYVGQIILLPKKKAEFPAGKPILQPPATQTPEVEKMSVPAAKAVITLVEGRAEMMTASGQSWQAARINSSLRSGDKVRILEEGRMELILDNRSVLRLAANSSLELKEFEQTPRKEQYSFFFSFGKMWSRVTRMLGFGSIHRVETPTAIAAVQGTSYDLQVDPSQQTMVRVFSGRVQIYNPFAGDLAPGQKVPKLKKPTRVSGPTRISKEEWTQLVLQQYQQVTFGRKGRSTITAFDLDNARKEAWIRWNEERDRDFYGE